MASCRGHAWREKFAQALRLRHAGLMVGKRVRAVVAAFVLVALTGTPGPASANGWEHGAVPYQTLIEALSFESAHIREQAAHSLGFRGQPEAVGPLVERLALPVPDGGVRQAIYIVLGQLGEQEALPALAACLAEESAALRCVTLGTTLEDRADPCRSGDRP